MKLADLMMLMGYGSKIVIVDKDTDEEVYYSDNFQVPYALKPGTVYKNAEVKCIGNANEYIYIWIESCLED